MNDRFKFRVWNKSEMHSNDFVVTATGYVGKITEEFLGNCVFNQEDLTADNECILMQCTGLKDKNDKLIYEGDIVKTSPSGFFDKNRDVFYIKFTDGFRLCYKDWQTIDTIGGFSNKLFEVIGNIYENSELLESEVE